VSRVAIESGSSEISRLEPGLSTLFCAIFAAIGEICMTTCLYLDTFAVLRAVLENGTSPENEELIAAAPALIMSRLSVVESSRAFTVLRPS
jgi:hypothetical protein